VTEPLTPAQRQRLRNPANLWRALIPLLLIVGLLVLLVWPRGAHSDGVHVVDTTAPIASARTEAGFTLLAPVDLDRKWRPTSTEFIPAAPASGATFRIGYVSPTGQYAEFIEGNDAADAIAAQYGPLTAENPITVDGRQWEGFRRSNDRKLLRHTASGVTVIVTGSASETELIELAASLH
jgi:hypothetical protein